MNYFELFGFEQHFDIPLNELSTRYRALLSTVHPDKFSHKSQSEQTMAVMKSAQINDGFECLKDPIRRAEHLLTLAGMAQNDEATTLKDTQFLMQQMEWREHLESLSHAANPELAIADFGDQIQQEKQSQMQTLQHALNQKDWSTAADWIFKLKFILKLQRELEHLEDTLLDL